MQREGGLRIMEYEKTKLDGMVVPLCIAKVWAVYEL